MYLAPFVPVNMEKEENHAGSWIPVLGLQLALCVSSGRNVHADSPNRLVRRPMSISRDATPNLVWKLGSWKSTNLNQAIPDTTCGEAKQRQLMSNSKFIDPYLHVALCCSGTERAGSYREASLLCFHVPSCSGCS